MTNELKEEIVKFTDSENTYEKDANNNRILNEESPFSIISQNENKKVIYKLKLFLSKI